MKKCFIWIGIILSCTTFLHAWNPPDFTLGATGDTKTVTLSTTNSSPTQILTRDAYVQKTWIVNASTFSIFVSTLSTNISTTTVPISFQIPGVSSGQTANIWSPDGVNSPYNGPLWAVAATQSPPTISIWRSK